MVLCSRERQPRSLPTETAGSSGNLAEEDSGERGERKRSTWGGRESRQKPSHKRPKRSTELFRARRAEVDYPQPLKTYNIHEKG